MSDKCRHRICWAVGIMTVIVVGLSVGAITRTAMKPKEEKQFYYLEYKKRLTTKEFDELQRNNAVLFRYDSYDDRIRTTEAKEGYRIAKENSTRLSKLEKKMNRLRECVQCEMVFVQTNIYLSHTGTEIVVDWGCLEKNKDKYCPTCRPVIATKERVKQWASTNTAAILELMEKTRLESSCTNERLGLLNSWEM